MRTGLIADLVIIVAVAALVIVCTHHGFVRSVLRWLSTLLAVLVAVWGGHPVANFLEDRFGLATKIAGWQVPVLSGDTILYLLTMLGLFIVARLVLLLLDRILRLLNNKVKALGVVDRLLGFVYGVLFAIVLLGFAFMLIDVLELQGTLRLTSESGGILGHRLFSWYQDHFFPLISELFKADEPELTV